QFLAPFARLSGGDPKSAVLIRTLRAWFANNRHPTLTAKALHIHRNTLDYRLQKISEITGMNLDAIDDTLLLYIGMQLSAP
ncbi:MAG: helix-turn-helix domain-containing protein, partial [Dechloromonas sp.]|nr:helix-turn-helix domain-containing protein [Dechloromonas sp.]